jgi:hypothetical protein
MSAYTTCKMIAGEVGGTPLDLVLSKYREALIKIYQQCDWSFQRGITYANWLVPGNVASSGTTTVMPNSNQVILNDAATAAINTYLASPNATFITNLQYRDPQYSIYNIVGYDNGTINPPFVTLTLDRPWMEPTYGGGQSYMIYQVYFVAPVQNFSKFIEMRDTTDGFPIDFWSMTQAMLAVRDSQRLIFSDPSFCVPAGVDTRPGTSTPGWPMFELWPQQLSYEPYSFSYRELGPVPVTQQDFFSFFPPYPLSDELVEWRTREVLYQFKEAQKDKTEARGSGANWLMLAQMAKKEYNDVIDKIIAIDLNLNGEAISTTSPPSTGMSQRPWANRLGGLNVGGYPDNND